jgi:ribosome-binding ATPase YchF (GTP1/OBG family)
MKIFNFGLAIDPGKYKYKLACMDKLVDKFSPQKVTAYSVEVTDTDLESCDAVIFNISKKLDFVLIDLEKVEKRIARAESQEEKDLLNKVQKSLEEEILISDQELSPGEKETLKTLQLVTLKPALGKEATEDVNQLIKEVLAKAGIILFFTAGKKDVRAWSLNKGLPVVEAAGRIHSDLKRGFIRAEVANCRDLDNFFNMAEARSKGLVKVVDKDYIMEENDIIEIKFNV